MITLPLLATTEAAKFTLHPIDYSIMVIYCLFVIGIGFALKKQMKSSSDFFLSGRSIPAWVTGLAFISANLGALEVMGMAANGAKYGMLTTHFYWIGAVLAMVFLAVFMMPFYYGSKARSAPEYLKLRFDEKTRGLNAVSFAIMTVMGSGISMHALASLLENLMGWNYDASLVVSSIIVLAYVLKGGLTSAIYTEVLQFFLIVFGFAPVVILGLKKVGGIEALKEKLTFVGANSDKLGLAPTGKPFGPDAWLSIWSNTGSPSSNSMGIDWFGLAFGLGFVLAFGYWCTNFLVVQRAMAANSMSAARRTPIIAAVPKIVFPILVIMPGLIAIALHSEILNGGTAFIPKGADGSLDYNNVITVMIKEFCPVGLLGLALTALLASFMSGMAGNVTAFNTVWTYDIYQSYFAPNKSDDHYMWMGRVATVVGIVISIGCAYIAKQFNNVMDVCQLVFGFVNAPLFATFLMGMFWKRATGHGAFFGLLAGTVTSAVFHGNTIVTGVTPSLVKGAWIHKTYEFHSEMAQNFWLAIFAFSVALIVTVVVSLATKQQKTDEDLKGLVYSLTPKQPVDENEAWIMRPAVAGTILLAITIGLNILFW